MTHGTREPRARARGDAEPRPDAAHRPMPDWRQPSPSDRARVREIIEASGQFRPDEVEVALEVLDEYCDAPDEDYHGLAMVDASDTLIGFAFFGETPCARGTWDLYWIAIDPNVQGRGLGRELLSRAESRMADAGARMALIETSSRADYSNTRRFYAACGYQEAARVPDYYDEGDDLVVFMKRFATRGRR